MELCGINFGNVFCASGALNFFGEGYPYHKVWRLAGLSFNGAGFVAKTTTLEPRAGNMPLMHDGTTPQEIVPKCIVIKPNSGHILNAVGGSGRGAVSLFERRMWQQRTRQFFISFMAVGKDKKERLDELKEFVRLVRFFLPGFKAPFGIQRNYACPNVGLHLDELVDEIGEGREIVARLGLPDVVKLNPLVSIDALLEIQHQCDAIALNNTVPWGKLPESIDWEEIFGTPESPLASLGGGGLSGPAVRPIVIDLINDAIEAGVLCPLIGGNGIQHWRDAEAFFEAGASAIEIGCVGMVRPQNCRSIIRFARSLQTTRRT